MYGSLFRTYPSFNVRNIGIGLIKTKNNKPEKEVFVNYIKDKYGTWIKVGIFKANACETIRDMMYTTHNLSILTDQNIDSTFSADFGNMRPSEVRVLGATDYQNWEETRTIDFVYNLINLVKDINNGNISSNQEHGGMWVINIITVLMFSEHTTEEGVG